MPDRSSLSLTQVQAAMKAMTDKALQKPNEPVAMAIVDDTGNLVAYLKMEIPPVLVAVTRSGRHTRRLLWA